MATITPSWTENVSVSMSDASPADTVISTGAIDLDTEGYDRVVVQMSITWHGSATDYADINVYGSADSGSTDDNIVYYSRRVDASAGATSIFSFVIDGVPFANLAVDNQSNQEITTLAVEYAGRQWTSA